MPQTAAELGIADPGEPMANLHGAARYLTAQLGTFGRLDYALAAYNAGPQRITQCGGVPPFRETRDYVALWIGGRSFSPSKPCVWNRRFHS